MQNRRKNEHTNLWIFHEIAKWRRWRLMLHDRWQWQLPRNRAVISQRDDKLMTLKISLEIPGNPNDRLKFHRYRAQLQVLRLFTFRRLQLILRAGWRLTEIAQMACSRRQKHR